MSWTLNIPKVIKEEFTHAVYDAIATGQPEETPGLKKDVDAARFALVYLATRIKRPYIIASAGGHCLSDLDENQSRWHDGITISISGTEN